MTQIVLGVIGHVDHGKTALVRALTGQETDRLAEEKKRGISIALGFAHLEAAPGVEIDLIDMPGHERFVRTMVAGATGMDAVLLVVAANEAIQPQTIEHVDIAGLLGIRRAVVAISKADLVEANEAQLVADEAADLLARAGLLASRPLFTSVVSGEGIDALRQRLAALAAEQQPRPDDRLLYLPVDRAFAIAGHGPVVTGTLRGARLAPGDTLELLPHERKVRVRSVQVHGRKVDVARPGQRVALNLRDVEIGELHRGVALAAPDALTLSEWLTVSIRSVAGAQPLKNGMRLRALLGTDDVAVRLRLLDRDLLEPGCSALAQLKCAKPVALPAGEHVILRLASPARTVAGGRVLEPVVQRHRRNAPALLRRLGETAALVPEQLVVAEVSRAAGRGTSLRRLSQLTGFTTRRVQEVLAGEPVRVARVGLVVADDAMERALLRIRTLAARPGGITEERLATALPGIGAAVLREALAHLLAARSLVKQGSSYVVPDEVRDRARADGEAAVAARIVEQFRASGLAPPRPGEILADPAARRAVDQLLRDGTLIRAVDRAKGKEIIFHRDAIADARRRLEPLLGAGPGLLPTEIGAALDISRKYSMPLIDYFDTVRFTRRVGDRRLLWSAGEPSQPAR